MSLRFNQGLIGWDIRLRPHIPLYRDLSLPIHQCSKLLIILWKGLNGIDCHCSKYGWWSSPRGGSFLTFEGQKYLRHGGQGLSFLIETLSVESPA